MFFCKSGCDQRCSCEVGGVILSPLEYFSTLTPHISHMSHPIDMDREMEKRHEIVMNLVLMLAEFFAVSVSPTLFSDDELVDSSSSNVEPIGNGVGKLNLKRGKSLLIQGGGGLDIH